MTDTTNKVEVTRVSLTDALREHPESHRIWHHTLDMARALASDTPPTAEMILRFKRQLAEGLIDANAAVFKISNHPKFETGHEIGHPLWLFLLHDGSWVAESIYPDILTRVDNFNCDELPWADNLRRAIYSHNPGYIAALVRYPGVDVDKQIYDDGYTLLEECRKVIEDHERNWSKLAQGKWTKDEAEYAARVLLDRGAVMNQQITSDIVQVEYVAQELRSRGAAVVEHDNTSFYRLAHPYVRQWQQEWDAFGRSEISVAQLTHEMLGHFYSLGHLAEAMDPERWRGHEQEAIGLFEQLPQWVRRREPCAMEYTVLVSRMKPGVQVQQWSSQPRVASGHEKA